MPSDNVEDSKVVENVNILSEITSNAKDVLVDSVHHLLMRSTCLLIVPMMT